MKKIVLIIVFVFMGIQAFAQAPTSGLLAYYGFEGNGNSHNGLYNLSNLHGGTPITYSSGGNNRGLAAWFDNTALQTTAISPQITNEFTIAFWHYNPLPQTQIYASRFEMFGSAFYRNDGNAGNQSLANISISNSSWVGPNMSVQLLNSSWQHIAITYHTNGFVTIWVNGNYDNTLQYNASFANLIKYNQIFSIGGGADGFGNFVASKGFKGYIDEVYVYNRGLNSAEINQVKNDTAGAGGTPPTISAISHLPSNNSATVKYSLNANNNATTSIVKYGTNADYGQTGVFPNQVTGFSASGNTTTTGTAFLPNLTPSTFYYYEITATNLGGSTTSTVGTFTTTASGGGLASNLLAYYNFENNDNSYDNVHNLTNISDPNYNPTFSSSAGKFGVGRNFGLGGGVLTNTSMATVFNIQQYTIAFWERRTTNSVPYSSSFELFGSHYMRVTGSNMSAGYRVMSNGIFENAGMPATTYMNTWTHYAFVFGPVDLANPSGPKNMKCYVNGVLVSSNGNYANTEALHKFNSVISIGNGTNADGTIHASKAYSGFLDEFYIYNRALSATDIGFLMNNSAGVSTLSTQNFQFQNLKASIYPNPANDNFTIDIENEVKTIEIYSLQGQKVMESTSKNVNVSNLSKGIYMVRIEDTENAISTKRLVIE